MRMTPLMRDALTRSASQPLRHTRTDRPGADRPPAPWPTLRALERRGLAVTRALRNRRGEQVTEWHPTEAGREALRPIERRRVERPVYLSRSPQAYGPIPNRTDYTTNPARALDRLEVLPEPDGRWVTEAQERLAAVQDRRVRARRLAQLRRIA